MPAVFFHFILSFTTSVAGSGLFPPLYFSARHRACGFLLFLFSFSSLYTLPVLSDQTRISPQPARVITATGHRSDYKGKWDIKKESTQKNQESRDSTCLVTVGVGVLMGCDRVDIGFGYSPSRFQELRCRYGYALHVIFWSQNMDLNSSMDRFLHY